MVEAHRHGLIVSLTFNDRVADDATGATCVRPIPTNLVFHLFHGFSVRASTFAPKRIPVKHTPLLKSLKSLLASLARLTLLISLCRFCAFPNVPSSLFSSSPGLAPFGRNLSLSQLSTHITLKSTKQTSTGHIESVQESCGAGMILPREVPRAYITSSCESYDARALLQTGHLCRRPPRAPT